MENKNLENLFREKLRGMVIEPSMEANEEFATRLKRRQHQILFRRISIAASILFLALAGTIGFLPDNPEKGDIAVEQSGRNDTSSNTASSLGNMENDLTLENNENIQPVNALADETVSIRSISPGNSDHPVVIESPNDTEKEPQKAGQKETPGKMQVDNQTGEVLIADIGSSITDPSDEVLQPEPLTDTFDPIAGDYLMDNSAESQGLNAEPVKITIEYIAAGSRNEGSQTKLRAFYSKMDNIKGVDEMIGDFREYKDRLFALEFKNDNKVKDEK